ncbi:MAG: hypothetical protein ACMXYL_01500 [Candidatus Woesearchaeota archaeon]
MNTNIVIFLIIVLMLFPMIVHASNETELNMSLDSDTREVLVRDTNHASVSLYIIENPDIEQNRTMELIHDSLVDETYSEEQTIRSSMITGMAIGSGERIHEGTSIENLLKTIIGILIFTSGILLAYLIVIKKKS